MFFFFCYVPLPPTCRRLVRFVNLCGWSPGAARFPQTYTRGRPCLCCTPLRSSPGSPLFRCSRTGYCLACRSWTITRPTPRLRRWPARRWAGCEGGVGGGLVLMIFARVPCCTGMAVVVPSAVCSGHLLPATHAGCSRGPIWCRVSAGCSSLHECLCTGTDQTEPGSGWCYSPHSAGRRADACAHLIPKESALSPNTSAKRGDAPTTTQNHSLD